MLSNRVLVTLQIIKTYNQSGLSFVIVYLMFGEIEPLEIEQLNEIAFFLPENIFLGVFIL